MAGWKGERKIILKVFLYNSTENITLLYFVVFHSSAYSMHVRVLSTKSLTGIIHAHCAQGICYIFGCLEFLIETEQDLGKIQVLRFFRIYV